MSNSDGLHAKLTEAIIGAAIAVHRVLSAGFVEAIYEGALFHELTRRGFAVERQKIVPVLYDGVVVGEHRIDLLVEGSVVLELKAVERLLEVHTAQIMSTLKAANLRVGLLINFKETKLVNGVKRIVL